MTPFADLDVIVFDILGTMVDEPGGIRRGVRTLLPDVDEPRTSELLEVWSRHVDAQQREVVAGRRPYANSAVIDLEAATRVAADAGITDPDAVRALAASAQRLEPWPDSSRALDRIASRFPVAGLSNASSAALTRISAHAGLRWHQVLSAEEAQSYKPDPTSTASRSPTQAARRTACSWSLPMPGTCEVHRPWA